MIAKELRHYFLFFGLSALFILTSCEDKDIIVQSLFDLAGAPLEYDDSQATKFINVAAATIEVSKNKPENLAKIRQTIIHTMEENPETELILFGETILGCWYEDENPHAYQLEVAETIPGPSTNSIAQLADSLNIYVGFGISELKEGNLFNSQVIINPDGDIEAIYRKFTMTKEDKESGFTPAEKIPENVKTVTINDIKLGMLVCADVRSYWLANQLVGKEVEVILHSLAALSPEFPIDAISRQFNAWVVFANRYGGCGDLKYSGNTFISDPAGNIRISGGGEEVVLTYRIGVR